ncbi:DUF4007 family protein [Parasutterella excrementihominis]|uniref:DUF4007 family protein n=1 Tax=Parasutterella excrementihominis TaxID=487175 RepID=UPI00242B814E|nr:DUF4007 family protein [Parasutterella excrementihominis]
MTTSKRKNFQFSGHETFNLRQNWLYKAVSFCRESLKRGESPNFNGPDAMVSLGVGKNMVSSLKWWGLQTGFLENCGNRILPSELSKVIFGDEINDDRALDPFGESLVTAWLAHWNLCSRPNKFTAAWYLFNVYNDQQVSREQLQKRLETFVEENGCNVTKNTLKRDIEVVFRSYTLSQRQKKDKYEDKVDSLFSCLGLISSADSSVFEIIRTHRGTLPTAFFVWATLDHWERLNELSPSKSLDWFQISFAANSPGRVFKLSERDLNERLEEVESISSGKLLWTDQLGIKNLVCKDPNLDLNSIKRELLIRAYRG